MPVAYAVSNRRDALIDVHPGDILDRPLSSIPTSSGAFRAVRCRLTASGTYAAGGTAVDTLGAATGIRDIWGVLLVPSAAPAGTWTGVPRWNAATRKLEMYTLAGAELGAVAATGQFEVIVYGLSG